MLRSAPGSTIASQPKCCKIKREIEDAETSVSQFQVEARGLLRVNAPMSFGTMFLGRLMGQFMAHHSDLQIELVLSDRRPAPDSRVTHSPNEIEQTTEMS